MIGSKTSLIQTLEDRKVPRLSDRWVMNNAPAPWKNLPKIRNCGEALWGACIAQKPKSPWAAHSFSALEEQRGHERYCLQKNKKKWPATCSCIWTVDEWMANSFGMEAKLRSQNYAFGLFIGLAAGPSCRHYACRYVHIREARTTVHHTLSRIFALSPAPPTPPRLGPHSASGLSRMSYLTKARWRSSC